MKRVRKTTDRGKIFFGFIKTTKNLHAEYKNESSRKSYQPNKIGVNFNRHCTKEDTQMDNV